MSDWDHPISRSGDLADELALPVQAKSTENHNHLCDPRIGHQISQAVIGRGFDENL